MYLIYHWPKPACMDIHSLDFVYLFSEDFLATTRGCIQGYPINAFFRYCVRPLVAQKCHPPNSQAKIRRNRNSVGINYRFFWKPTIHFTQRKLTINPSIYLFVQKSHISNLSIGLSFYPSLSLKICLNRHLSTTK